MRANVFRTQRQGSAGEPARGLTLEALDSIGAGGAVPLEPGGFGWLAQGCPNDGRA